MEPRFDGRAKDPSAMSDEELRYCLGEGRGFDRIRRVTGYLGGETSDRWCDGKQAELRDRVKHSVGY